MMTTNKRFFLTGFLHVAYQQELIVEALSALAVCFVRALAPAFDTFNAIRYAVEENYHQSRNNNRRTHL